MEIYLIEGECNNINTRTVPVILPVSVDRNKLKEQGRLTVVIFFFVCTVISCLLHS